MAKAKARNFPVQSIGSLLDEPFTGVVYLKDSGITSDFHTLKGKKIGYVGEFGKVCGLSLVMFLPSIYLFNCLMIDPNRRVDLPLWHVT